MSRFRWMPALAVVLVAACLASARPVLAQEAGAVTLDEVIADVLARNPSLRAARLEAEALATREAQASALPDPTAALTYQPFPVLTARGAQRSVWRVEQMVPYPGTLGLRGDVARLSAEVAAHEADVLAADLVLEAKRAYVALYRAQRLAVLVEAFEDDLGGFAEAAAVRYEVGEGPQQAVLKAQLERTHQDHRLHELRLERRAAAERLARLTHRPGTAEALVAAALAPPPVPAADADALLATALAARAEVAALDAAAARAERQEALARKAFRPDLGLALTWFDVAERDMPPTATGRDALGVTAMVKVPLQRGRLRAGLEEARLRRAQVEARREALEAAVQTRLDDLASALGHEAETLRLLAETLLPQAEVMAEATVSAYTTGRAAFLDLLDAQRTLFALRTSYEESLARYLTTAAELERALGVRSLTELPAAPAGPSHHESHE